MTAKHKRPSICDGCSGNPKTSTHKPAIWGDHVPPYGPLDAQLLVIGIAPAEVEEQTGIPLTGPTGKKVDIAINWALGGRPIRIRKMNIVNCRTCKPGLSKSRINRDPTAAEFRECAQRWLLPELRTTKAKAILLCGQLPFDLVLKPLGVKHHMLPKQKNKYTFALCMGHRNPIPRSIIL